jgi:urate oxidase
MTTTARLVSDRYGKSRVRLMRLTRRDATPDIPAHHDVDEWNVQILLSGDFETAHTLGDNSKILPTDTMKNTVYFVARKSSATSIEDYAKELVDFLLSRNPQVTTAECVVESILWKRLTSPPPSCAAPTNARSPPSRAPSTSPSPSSAASTTSPS